MIRFSGGWKKTTEDKRAVKYPRFLEYRDSGLYSARSDENGIHPVWDAGTWEIVAPYRLNRLFRGRPTPF